MQRELFNSIAGKEVFDVLIDENDLAQLLVDAPQIKVMEAFSPNGLRVGLTRRLDENDNEIIEGTPKYPPDAALATALKDKIEYDIDGNQTGTTPRVLADDDVQHWFGWERRDFIN